MTEAPGDAGASSQGHERWLVVGASGAGKSTLAREMAQILHLPLIHLDRHYWKPGWVKSETNEWKGRVTQLCSGADWIMDGNFGSTIPLRLRHATSVVLLDLPTWQCLWGIYARSTIGRGDVRSDLADGCEEQLPDWGFVWWVLGYRWRSRPQVLRQIAAEPGVDFHHLKSRRAAHHFLERLRRRTHG